jgi:hypothetical protein
MFISLRRPAALVAAIGASALSLGLALTPLAVRAASPLDNAMAACATAWQAQPGAGTLEHVRLDSMSDSGRKTKLVLRAKAAAGATMKIKCVLDSTGTVTALGNTPVTQLASREDN